MLYVGNNERNQKKKSRFSEVMRSPDTVKNNLFIKRGGWMQGFKIS